MQHSRFSTTSKTHYDLTCVGLKITPPQRLACQLLLFHEGVIESYPRYMNPPELHLFQVTARHLVVQLPGTQAPDAWVSCLASLKDEDTCGHVISGLPACCVHLSGWL